MRHLEHVRAIAFEYDQRLGGSVRQFVDEITRRRAEPDEMEPSLADESQNAVRILSVHAAKGLEFDTVILPDLSFPTTAARPRSSSRWKSRAAWCSPGAPNRSPRNFRFAGDEKLKKVSLAARGGGDAAPVLRRRHAREDRRRLRLQPPRRDEERRLPQVPHRRARHGQGDARGDVARGGPRGARDRRRAGGIREDVDVQAAAARTRHAALRRRHWKRSWLRRQVVSLTDLLARRDGDPRPSPRWRRGAPDRAIVPPASCCIACSNCGTARSDHEPLLRQLAVEAAADADAVTRVRKRLATIARSPMLQRIARAETIGREVAVHFVEDGIPVERRIDRILREQMDGAPHDLVIDYKSGTADPQRVNRDREQVERYCRAVAAITGDACAGALWYIDLESDEVVEVDFAAGTTSKASPQRHSAAEPQPKPPLGGGSE